MIVGDGYIPYHIRVRVEAGSKREFAQIVAQALEIKREFDGARSIEPFPQAVIDRLARVSGIVRICPDGAISSVINALKMVCALSERPCAMWGILGTGPIADAIGQDLTAAGIKLQPTVRTSADSSVEISIEDTDYRYFHEFQVHFLPARERCHTLCLPEGEEETVQGLVVSRPNRGRAKMARRLFCRGGLVSLCIGGFGRHVQPENYLDLLGSARQVLINHPEMRQMARTVGVALPRSGKPELSVECYLPLAERLATEGGRNRLVALVFRRAVLLHTPDLGPAVFRVPVIERHRVPVSRFHGALIARTLPLEEYLPANASELEALGNTALQAALFGREQYPLGYPPPTFAGTGTGTWRQQEVAGLRGKSQRRDEVAGVRSGAVRCAAAGRQAEAAEGSLVRR
jgi:hypothetical protein